MESYLRLLRSDARPQNHGYYFLHPAPAYATMAWLRICVAVAMMLSNNGLITARQSTGEHIYSNADSM